MHLIESQATQSGQSINNIDIYPKYFPLPFDKYIVFGPYSKDSKNYDYYRDVLSILLPILNKEKIRIVQIGAANEPPLPGTYYIAGQTNINQVSYLIKNSLLFFGADSFGQHLAGHYDIPLVDLIVNNYTNCVKPYFGNPDKQIIIEPPRAKDEKPSFALKEQPKSINNIQPEQIAESVCNLLKLKYDFPYKQIFMGDIYIATMIESSMDNVYNPNQFGTNNLICRMDYNFNEQILSQQMQISDVSILTNKEMSIQLLETFKSKVKEIVYIIESKENHGLEFIKNIQKLGINFRILSTLSQEEINKLKIHFMEIGVISKKPEYSPKDIKELKDEKLDELYFKSGKFTLGRNKLYSSKSHYLLDKCIQSFDEICPIINDNNYWEDVQSFRILKKIV